MWPAEQPGSANTSPHENMTRWDRPHIRPLTCGLGLLRSCLSGGSSEMREKGSDESGVPREAMPPQRGAQHSEQFLLAPPTPSLLNPQPSLWGRTPPLWETPVPTYQPGSKASLGAPAGVLGAPAVLSAPHRPWPLSGPLTSTPDPPTKHSKKRVSDPGSKRTESKHWSGQGECPQGRSSVLLGLSRTLPASALSGRAGSGEGRCVAVQAPHQHPLQHPFSIPSSIPPASPP